MQHQEIPELTAARIIQGLMETRDNDRIEVVNALLGWITTLVRDAKPETRIDAARLMFTHAVWLAPHEKFDQETIKLVREFAWPYHA
jgi:hypothetical protein